MNARRNSNSIQVSGRSVDDAVLTALRELNLSRDQVDIEVIKQGSRGLLGLLGEEAVVRVTARTVPAALEDDEEEPVPSERSAPRAPRAAREATTSLPGQERSNTPVAASEDVARLGAEALQQLLDHMGLSASVEQEVLAADYAEPGAVLLNITGSDLGVLIGRQGETLRDLQFVTSLIVSRNTQHWPNLVVDVEHYKSRRQKTLVDIAKRMADRVRASGQPISLEPMPPHERRFVHLALRDDPDVFTESTGQDEKRRVVILPKK